LNYLSICSGIESASTAWHHLGWKPLGFSEIEPFPSAVLAHHYPDVSNFGDMTKHKDWRLNERLDLLVGGTPCQAFSVAGARRSLEDERGNLTLTFCNIANQFNPRFTLWENVPGVLNTKDNAFGCLISGLAGLDDSLETDKGKWPGNGLVIGGRRRVAWVTLDAQYFGVPQRRRRVFVLAVDAQSGADSPDLCPSKILSIGTSLRRDTPPRRKTGESLTHPVAPSLTSSGRGVERAGETRGQDPVVALEGFHTTSVAGCLRSGGDGGVPSSRGEHLVWGGGLKFEGFHTTGAGYWQEGSGTLRAREQDSHENLVTIMAHGQANTEIRSDGGSPSLTCNHEAPIVVHGTQDPCVSDIAFAQGRNNGGENVVAFQQNASGDIFTNPILGTLGTNSNASGRNTQMAQSKMQVRRLTPEECEILQGFPVGYTDIKPKGKPTPDGPRYKVLGNSMAVPVMRWIGEQISKSLTS